MFVSWFRSSILTSLWFTLIVCSTEWDDNRDDGQSRVSHSTSTLSPPIEPLFDSSPCYLNQCEDEIIEAIRSGNDFSETVRCHQLDTQCHCCLRRQLNRNELDNLYQSISTYINRKPKSSDKLCKVLNCDDYQVKAIRSLADPNGECHPHGNGDCECCVKPNRKIDQNRSTSQFNGLNNGSLSLTNNSNHYHHNPLDLESNFFNLFPSSKSYDSSSSSSPNSPSNSPLSSSSSSNLFDVDCLHHSCNGAQVKAIKRLPSQIITCVKIGNSDDCKCCFNSSLSIFERVKYEIELTEINNRRTQNPKEPSSSPGSSYPPSLSRRSPSIHQQSPPAESSFYDSLEPNLDCSLHHCQSDLVQLVRSVPTHIVQCKPVNGYFNTNRCRCCVDSSLTGLDFKNILRFVNF